MFSSLCKWGLRLLAGLSVFFLALIFLPGIPPHVTFTAYELAEERPLTGALAPNGILDHVERLLEGKITLPESVAVDGAGRVFINTLGGKIVSLTGRHFETLETVADLGEECEKPWHKTCGYPLGLRVAPDGRLLAIEAYRGIYSVDVKTGEKELVVDASKEIDGVLPMFPDDLDIDDEGNIYWSDASTFADLHTGVAEIFSDPTGRLIKSNPKTRTSTALMTGLHFANGIQVSPGSDFVLVADALKRRIWRYWLKGPKSGTSEIFVDRLPGVPDNIRARPGGGYDVAIVWVRPAGGFDPMAFLARRPWLRKAYLRLAFLAKATLEAVASLLHNDFAERMASRVLSFEPFVRAMFGTRALVVEVDEEGEIVGSLQGDSGRISFISEIRRFGDHVFLGSPYNDFLGYLNLASLPKEEQPTKAKEGERKDAKQEL